MRSSDFSPPKGSSMITTFLVCFFLVSPVMSQEVKKGEIDKPTFVMDRITVTANKMEEDIQKIPQSISVINESKIEEMGLQNSADVLDLIPGMLTTSDHGTGVTFRGLKRSMFTQNNPVVIYVDGVPISNSFGFDFSLVDVERIEVLRGPQGTLYGKDALGAVVNVITKSPDNSWHGKIGSEYSSWNTWRTRGSVNGSILKDKLFLGLSGQYDKTDGWIKNEYPGMNENIGRRDKYDVNGFLFFKPTDRFRVRVGIENWEQVAHAPNDEKGLPYDFMGTGAGYTVLGDFDRDMAEHLYQDMEPKETTNVNAQNLLIDYDFDRFKVESITTHRLRDLAPNSNDADFAAGGPADGLIMFHETELTTWTEELRLTSANTSGLRWVGGLYLDKEDEEDRGGFQLSGALMGSPMNMEMQSASDIETTTQAIFGQIMLPFAQNFELTLGGRYQHINKKIEGNLYMLPVQGPFPAEVTGMNATNHLKVDKTWNIFLPKVALAWFVSDQYTVWASFSNGYMPGGFNTFASSTGEEENTFEPQKTTNYEIGIKADHDQWKFNLAVFYMDIADIHIYKTVGNIWLTDNAESAHSFGTELEATWLPIKGLEISTAVSLMQSEYDDYDLGIKKLDGEDVEGAPRQILRLSARYHHPSGFYGCADVRNVGKVNYYDASSLNLRRADAYTLFNLRFGWLYNNWDIYAFVDNLTDEKYLNAFKSSASLGGIAGFGDPRSIGVGLSYNF